MSGTPRVLITGFEPFAGAKLNSSQVVVEWLARQAIEGLFHAILPVEYERSVERALQVIEEVDPEIIISLGQAEGRAKVSFERVAINLDDARIADNAGEIRRDVPIIVGGEAAYFSAFPVREVVESLSASGLPAEESLSAGAFVCNHLFYGVMRNLVDSQSKRWMDFVHLPLVTEQGTDFPGKPTVDKEVQARVIIDAVQKVREFWVA